MPYIPCNGALLAQEPLLMTQKSTFFAQRFPKLLHNSVHKGLEFLSESILFGERPSRRRLRTTSATLTSIMTLKVKIKFPSHYCSDKVVSWTVPHSCLKRAVVINVNNLLPSFYKAIAKAFLNTNFNIRNNRKFSVSIFNNKRQVNRIETQQHQSVSYLVTNQAKQ